jgi:hypothetical protein
MKRRKAALEAAKARTGKEGTNGSLLHEDVEDN